MDISKGKPLEISDKPLFDDYFQRFPPEISELTFTNLFIWREHYEFRYYEWNEHLLIFSHDFNNEKVSTSKSLSSTFFLPPIGPTPNEIILKLFNNLKNIEIRRVPDKLVEKLIDSGKLEDLNIEILEDRNNWDYIYEKQAISNLSGNKYRQNRRWLTKFLDNYSYEFNLLSGNWLDKCKELQVEWCEMRECQNQSDLIEEQMVIYEALDNYGKLNFKGGILRIADKCVAYTFGEMLNNDTLVIHIEKAQKDFEGAYQAINNLFLKNCGLEDAIFVNREQDLGISGLRNAKESYKPIHMVKKSIIYQKK